MKKKLQKFIDALEEHGEFFFSLGSTKEDYNYITSVIKQQGYWSGTSYRLYFDNDLNLISVENRW